MDLFIPTMGRSERLAGIQAQIDSVTSYPHRVWFIVERHDLASIDACKDNKLFYIINHRSPSYAGSINSAWDCLQSEMFFAGADDLEFTQGWEVPLLENEGLVIRTNDGGGYNEVAAGVHATHYLVKGDYIKSQGGVINSSDPVLPECYDHNYTDREFIGTAKFRGVFTPCLESLVIHNHYLFGRSKIDATYKRTRNKISEDERVYESRRSLWNNM